MIVHVRFMTVPPLWCAAGRCWHRTRCPRRAVRTTALMGGPRHSLHAPNGVQSVSARPGSLLPWTRLGRLKELHDVAAWVLDQDLLPAGARYDLVTESYARGLQFRDRSGQIGSFHHEPIPAPWLRLASVRHRPRSRSVRSSKPER